jgi:hypothetical protein
LATSSGRSASAAALAVAVAALLLAAPAAAAARHVDMRTAIAAAASSPRGRRLLAANPGAHWDASRDRTGGTWTVVLEPAGGLNVLAAFTVSDRTGRITHVVVAPTLGPVRLNPQRAYVISHRVPAVRDWIDQYTGVSHSVEQSPQRVWTVKYYEGGDQIAEVHVDDASERAYEVWTGPQVGWMLARGLPSAYGRKVNEPYILWPMCALFLAGLVDWRRLRSWRTLDLAVLLGFAASLHWFNQGDVFVSTPLVYPPLVYVAARMAWIGATRRPRPITVGERHMLVLVALVFALMGFRLGLNNQDSNVIDVGYAGVAGASRLMDGVLPYGHLPDRTSKPCGGRYANGDPRAYIQPGGRCESPIASGDTYGPTVYLAYVPAVAALGWSGRWDSLPAAHVAAPAFDLLAICGLFVAGWRLASPAIGVLLAFGWAANPFTLYALNMNTNDALVGALVAWTLAALSLPAVRGALLAAAGLTKFAPLALVPLFASLQSKRATAAGFLAAAAALLSMLALDAHGLSLFWHRTLDYQLGRVTPMAAWTLPSFHPGWPDLTWLQRPLQVAAVVGVTAMAVFPRAPKDAAAVAALGATAIVALQLVASYWFYPYVCWWLPLALAGLLLPRRAAPAPA